MEDRNIAKKNVWLENRTYVKTKVSFNTYISELFWGIFSEKLKQFQMEKGKKYFCV